MNLTPIKDQILVEPIASPNKVGSIFIPDQARRTTQMATVIALGPKVTAPVKPGDRVHITEAGGTQFEIEGREHYLVTEGEILAVIE